MREVDVIRPNGTIESTLEQHGLSAGPDSIRLLGFPKQLFEFDVEIERKFLNNREVTVSVTIDLLTGTCRKNDIYPEIQSRKLSPTSLLHPRVDQETAAETARSFVRRKINRWYKSFTAPEIQIVRDDLMFKLFWLAPASAPNKVHIIDTITNQLTAQDVTVNEFARNSANSSLD